MHAYIVARVKTKLCSKKKVQTGKDKSKGGTNRISVCVDREKSRKNVSADTWHVERADYVARGGDYFDKHVRFLSQVAKDIFVFSLLGKGQS